MNYADQAAQVETFFRSTGFANYERLFRHAKITPTDLQAILIYIFERFFKCSLERQSIPSQSHEITIAVIGLEDAKASVLPGHKVE